MQRSKQSRWQWVSVVGWVLVTTFGAASWAQAPTPTLPKSWVDQMRWRCIGPATMSGRITALTVSRHDPNLWWAASASGGLLKTTNNGITFEHQFDRQATISIGDVQVAPSNPNIVWVGTGESNPRNSVSWGDGVYKSTDGGKTWKNMGLKKTFQIGSIAIHPKNPDIVYVGALGRLWGPNPDRGLYKTTDGGKTWKKILYVDDKTGVIDIEMHPKNPDVLLVATYERQRDGFDGNDPAKKYGAGSAIYRTTNGGRSFTKITKGLPSGKLGRIGLCFYARDPRHVYAVIESEKIGKMRPDFPFAGIEGTSAEAGARITKVVQKGPAERAGIRAGDIVIAIDDTPVYSYADLLAAIRKAKAGDKAVWKVVRDHRGKEIEIKYARHRQAGKRKGSPFTTRLGGQPPNVQEHQGEKGHEYGGVYHSEDGGVTWKRINSLNPRPMYFSQIRVDPRDRNHIWVLGIPLYHSSDGGKTFTADGAGRGVHVDHHALWIDPRDGRHMILGNDGGIYVTYDRGQHWDHLNHVVISQFYHVGVGPRRRYRVYGGLQDNGSWGAPNVVRHGSGPANPDWFRVGGGDGFICLVDPEDPDQLYVESQNGVMMRYHLKTGEGGRIQPKPPKGVQYRFNWKTPFLLSHHNSRIHYSAGNYVFRSLNRGRSIKAISPEISRTDRGAASALAESPLDEDVLYVGTTDGALWVTRSGGRQWHRIYPPEAKDASSEESAGKELAKKTAAAKKGGNKKDAKKSQPEASKKKPASSEKPSVPEGQPLEKLLPGPRWVSSLTASRFHAGRVYATFDGHRSNDDGIYPMVSEDYGKTWRSLRANLPEAAGSVRVLREDLQNENVLYLGCEFGCWVSVDRGRSWTRLNSNMPHVAVHEFAQHATSGELIAGTHGRGIWILDVTTLRQINAEAIAAPVKLYKPNTVVMWKRKPSRGNSGGPRAYVGQNPTREAILDYSLGRPARSVELKIVDFRGRKVVELPASRQKGFHR
ncbi:MAG TPA: PDZ domain-containing protein, partial [Planctomycetaceae bacterium]|nr:PDZ domain-containing protein [Planctomycetaceae bacterium]